MDTLQRRMAERAFLIDKEFARDRAHYDSFDQMPVNLQDWWVDRAMRFYATHKEIAACATRPTTPEGR